MPRLHSRGEHGLCDEAIFLEGRKKIRSRLLWTRPRKVRELHSASPLTTVWLCLGSSSSPQSHPGTNPHERIQYTAANRHEICSQERGANLNITLRRWGNLKLTRDYSDQQSMRNNTTRQALLHEMRILNLHFHIPKSKQPHSKPSQRKGILRNNIQDSREETQPKVKQKS